MNKLRKGTNPSRYLTRFFTGLFVFSATSLSVMGATEVTSTTTRTSTSRTTVTRPTTFESPLTTGLDIQYLPVSLKNYTWAGNPTEIPNGHGIHAAIEWLPLTTFGKLGVGLGGGYSFIKNAYFGRSRYATLNTYPIEAFLSYRFDFVKNQILVPFAKIGAELTLVRQTGDVVRPGTQTYWGLDYSAGIQLCLNGFDRHSADTFDRALGVNNTYVIFEYLRSQYLKEKREPNLTHEEFRIGLRFEM